MSLEARLGRLERIIGSDGADDRLLSVEDIRGLGQWLREQGFGISDGTSARNHRENIRVLRVALAAGLRTPTQFHLTIEDLLQAYEHVEAFREMRFGKGA
jgi:hypothetical protein